MSNYHVVQILEDSCIGCTKCIPACPVDAIVGASQTSHGVLSEFCIGCNLCIPACPVNCIEIVASEKPADTKQRAQIAKARVQNRKTRLAKEAAIKTAKDNNHAQNMPNEIQAALARSQQRKKFVWTADETN